MIDFEWKISLKIGDDNSTDLKKSSNFLKLFKPFNSFYKSIKNIIVFIANDHDWKYWYSYENGEDVYQILLNRVYETGFYYNEKNKNEKIFKTFSLNGNPVFCISVSENSKLGQVNTMHGQTMVPTNALISTSMAEAFLADYVYDQGYDPFIPLKVEYDCRGNAYTWYGRYTHFTLIPEYFEQLKSSFVSEEESIKTWLENYVEEEEDSPILAKILEKQAIENQQPHKRKYTKRKNAQ